MKGQCNRFRNISIDFINLKVFFMDIITDFKIF
jgi:hypothetical protein